MEYRFPAPHQPSKVPANAFCCNFLTFILVMQRSQGKEEGGTTNFDTLRLFFLALSLSLSLPLQSFCVHKFLGSLTQELWQHSTPSILCSFNARLPESSLGQNRAGFTASGSLFIRPSLRWRRRRVELRQRWQRRR